MFSFSHFATTFVIVLVLMSWLSFLSVIRRLILTATVADGRIGQVPLNDALCFGLSALSDSIRKQTPRLESRSQEAARYC